MSDETKTAVVPVEPTEAMLYAISTAVRQYAVPTSIDPEEVYFDNGNARQLFSYLLAAAPEALANRDPQAEPVAWRYRPKSAAPDGTWATSHTGKPDYPHEHWEIQPLYASPQDDRMGDDPWAGPGSERHDYHPDIMAMGDCSICGHTYEAHQKPKEGGAS